MKTAFAACLLMLSGCVPSIVGTTWRRDDGSGETAIVTDYYAPTLHVAIDNAVDGSDCSFNPSPSPSSANEWDWSECMLAHVPDPCGGSSNRAWVSVRIIYEPDDSMIIEAQTVDYTTGTCVDAPTLVRRRYTRGR
jgi:hypothetical protein